MLQQTRVEAVIPYYERFLTRFRSIRELADAPESDVLTAWSGLGYYSRARLLQRAAKQIIAQRLPESYEEIESLPGVGPYTAAAISSIALGLPYAAVDGNVIRVISRLTNDASESTSQSARGRFAEAAGRLLDPKRPGDFNQAMMELGATVCLPRTPNCGACPVAGHCAGRAAGTERELPVKLKKQKTRDVVLDLVILQRDSHIFLIRRAATERRLADFWELPGKEALARTEKAARIGEFRHQIVNDRFHISVWHTLQPRLSGLPPGKWVRMTELDTLPLTTIARKAIRNL